jgi:hypothetical protein
MTNWTQVAELFHGTDMASLSSYSLNVGRPVIGFSVDLRRCRVDTDFGQGFYLTTSEKQARNWANMRIRRRPARKRAVLLSFQVEREWLSSLEALCFIRPTLEFQDFVEDCRLSVSHHQRRGAKKSYDIVYGPMSLWPQDTTYGDGDQISIHTQVVATMLPEPMAADIAASPTGLFDRIRR